MITSYRETAEIVRAQIRSAKIDVEALHQPIRACEISRCKATCCHDGVYLSDEEKNGISQLLQRERDFFKQYGIANPEQAFTISADGNTWKTRVRLAEEGELASDYPSHFPKTRCVFLSRDGYCGIQHWSMENKGGDWYHKPLTCWIHPLLILPKTYQRSQPVLTLVNSNNDPQKVDGYPGFSSCTHCGRGDEGGLPAYRVLERELEALSIISGRDLLSEISR